MDFLREARLYCMLPTVSFYTFENWLNIPPLTIFIVGHSKISLVSETLVPLTDAPCTCARTHWGHSSCSPLWPPLPAPRPAHSLSLISICSLTRQLATKKKKKSLFKSYYFIEWLLKDVASSWVRVNLSFFFSLPFVCVCVCGNFNRNLGSSPGYSEVQWKAPWPVLKTNIMWPLVILFLYEYWLSGVMSISVVYMIALWNVQMISPMQPCLIYFLWFVLLLKALIVL